MRFASNAWPHEAERLRGDGELTDATTSLRDALELWRGDALADVADESFAEADRVRLTEMKLATVDVRIDADLALGRHADLVPELEHLVAADPVREHVPAQLMLALSRSGRQTEAAFVRLRQVGGGPHEFLVDVDEIELVEQLVEFPHERPQLRRREPVAAGSLGETGTGLNPDQAHAHQAERSVPQVASGARAGTSLCNLRCRCLLVGGLEKRVEVAMGTITDNVPFLRVEEAHY